MVVNWLFACRVSGSLPLEGRNPYEFFNNIEIRLKGRKAVCYTHLFYGAATYLTEDVSLDLFQKTDSVPERSYEGKVIDIHGLCICFLQLMPENSQRKLFHVVTD